MTRHVLPSPARRYAIADMDHERANIEQIERLELLCQRMQRPMLAPPFTKLRVVAYTNALNRRAR